MTEKGDSHYPIARLHVLCFVALTLLAGVTIALILRGGQTEWKRHQIRGHTLLEVATENDKAAASAAEAGGAIGFASVHFLEKQGCERLDPSAAQVAEICLRGLPASLGAGAVPRRDRCISCHTLAGWAEVVERLDSVPRPDAGRSLSAMHEMLSLRGAHVQYSARSVDQTQNQDQADVRNEYDDEADAENGTDAGNKSDAWNVGDTGSQTDLVDRTDSENGDSSLGHISILGGARWADGDGDPVAGQGSTLPIWRRPTEVPAEPHVPFPREEVLETRLALVTGQGMGAKPSGKPIVTTENWLWTNWGFRWTAVPFDRPNEPRIGLVEKGSPAELAGLRPGDVLLAVGDQIVAGRSEAEETLRRAAEAVAKNAEPIGKSSTSVWYPTSFASAAVEVPAITLRVKRGLPQPLAAHPWPELYVAEDGSHPASRFGCTICHDGLGLALDYRDAGHSTSSATSATPDGSVRQSRPGFHDQAVSPMILSEFTQSRCARCHTKVFDLVENETRFRGSAEYLVTGRRLVEQFGCYTCHDLGDRFSELRLRSPVREIAEEVLSWPTVPQDARNLAEQVLQSDEPGEALRPLAAALARWQGGLSRQLTQPRLPSHKQVELWLRVRRLERFLTLLQGVTATGLPKPGPSLRDVAVRLNSLAIQAMIADPQAARPGARMPQFFGLTEHLSPAAARERETFSRVETLALAVCIEAKSRPRQTPQSTATEIDTLQQSLQRPLRQGNVPGNTAGPAAKESHGQVEADAAAADLVDKGRYLFQTQGCLACHRHGEFPGKGTDFGPDLSLLAERVRAQTGRQWLRSWLENPQAVWPDTRMPRPQFRPDSWLYRMVEKDADQSATDAPSRPLTSADILDSLVAFLATSAQQSVRSVAIPSPSDAEIDRVLREYLAVDLPVADLSRVMQQGISAGELTDLAPEVAAGLAELLGDPSREKKLRYIGHKAIARYGCYGCHEIAGFEGWPPIAPSLAEWARKPRALLDYGEVVPGSWATTHEGRASEYKPTLAGGPTGFKLSAQTPLDQWLLECGERRHESWLWLKLTSPRVFDYAILEKQPLLQDLRMGRFAFSSEQRRAVMTFVLGLDGAEHSAAYSPYREIPREKAAEGRAVIERHGCNRCHILRPDTWLIRYLAEDIELTLDAFQPAPGDRTAPQTGSDDSSGEVAQHPVVRRALLIGLLERDREGQIVEDVDDRGQPLYYFMPWQPIGFGRRSWPIGEASLPVSALQIVARWAADGGEFTWQFYPLVLTALQELQFTMGPREAWGCCPPPLHHVGAAAQTRWLEQYLRNPYPIRPAVPLAMPRYVLTTAEIRALRDYFAVLAGGLPEEQEPWLTIEAQFLQREHDHPGRFAATMRLLRDTKTYCGKCHLWEADVNSRLRLPTEAPPLTEVYRRLRPEYVNEWVTRPKRILPYTAMPINFPDGQEPLDRSPFDASPEEQRQAVVDVLSHYDWYLRKQGEEHQNQTPSQ